MKPYYEEDGITIIHGDCAEVMPSLDPVDIVLTDPPYGMEYQSGYRIGKPPPKIRGDDTFLSGLVVEAVSLARCAAYVFCRWDNLIAGDLVKPTSVLAWVKNNWSAGDLNHAHGRQWEAICFYPGSNHVFHSRIPDVIYDDRVASDSHGTVKPVGLLKRLIAANEGDVVLDPFMGTGTTLRAAKDVGRKAIGIEVEERYCEIAAKRCSQGVFDWPDQPLDFMAAKREGGVAVTGA